MAEVAGSLVAFAAATCDWPAALRWLGLTHGLHEWLGIVRSPALLVGLDEQEAQARAEVGAALAEALRTEGTVWGVAEALTTAAAG